MRRILIVLVVLMFLGALSVTAISATNANSTETRSPIRQLSEPPPLPRGDNFKAYRQYMAGDARAWIKWNKEHPPQKSWTPAPAKQKKIVLGTSKPKVHRSGYSRHHRHHHYHRKR